MNSQAIIVITVNESGLIDIKIEGSGLALDVAESLFDDGEEGATA